MEPVFAALFGFWFAGEQLSMQGYTGAALVLLGIVASELLGRAHWVPGTFKLFKKRRANL
ncbi:hypothetical protein D3C81_2158640 [compost metagenome]